jgi:hypothetical protein
MDAVDAAWLHDLADVDLRAVFWFPFLDMFDWDYHDGTAPVDDYRVPVGLVRLRRDAGGGLVRTDQRARRLPGLGEDARGSRSRTAGLTPAHHRPCTWVRMRWS